MLKTSNRQTTIISIPTGHRISSNYYPFGSSLPTRSWSDASRAYRYGFNGKEKDNETANDNYDFGARIYDGRLGRWKSVDKYWKLIASNSGYSFSLNSPLFFIDKLGKYPKVAIIIVPDMLPDKNAFNDHVSALESQGYKIIYATNGKEALEAMNSNSTPDSPTENLILLSHGSPGGLSVYGAEDGIWTTSELEIYTKNLWCNLNHDENEKEYLKSKGIVSDINDPNYDKSKVDDALNDPNFIKDFNDFEATLWSKVQNKDELMNQYKNDHNIVTTVDIGNAMNSGEFNTKNLTIVLGGCNLSGYYPLDEQAIFSQELAVKTGATVYASQGYTQPEMDTNSKKSKKNTNRTSSKTWVKYSSDGTRKDLGKSTINLAKPE